MEGAATRMTTATVAIQTNCRSMAARSSGVG